jgi:hypothetical protein
VLERADQRGALVFSLLGTKRFQHFTHAKRRLDQLSGVTGWRLHDLRRTCVSGLARLGIAPHVADKILNHQSGTISGVAAVYQRHDFLAERPRRRGHYVPRRALRTLHRWHGCRQEALERWGIHVNHIVVDTSNEAGRMSFVATLAMLVLMPAAAASMPAVKSAQCPPGYIVSGGYCTPMFRPAPAAVPKVGQCRSSYAQTRNSCVEMRRN